MPTSPSQNKNRNKVDHKKATKITDEERRKLKAACDEHDKVQQSLAMLTLDRKLKIDQIEASFQAQWNQVFPIAVKKNEKKQDMLKDLGEKYGDAQINPVTGDIIRAAEAAEQTK